MADDAEQTQKAAVIHWICSCVHILSAITIFSVGVSEHALSTYNIEVSKSFNGVTRWKFDCFNNATQSYDEGYANCPDDNRLFRKDIGDPMAGPGFNVLLAAFTFAAVSGAFHAFNAIMYSCSANPTYDVTVEHTIRFADYAISAPIMLALINVLWGASNIAGVIVAPIGLCCLLLIANYLAVKSLEEERTKIITFYVLLVLFALCLYPTVSATYSAVSTSNKAHNEGSAPTFVAAFVAAFLLVFSSFIVPYYQALMSNFKVDKIVDYCVLSIVAKVTLHALLGVAVIQQTTMTTQNATEKTTAPSDPAPTLGFMIAGGVILCGIIMAFGFEWYVGTTFNDLETTASSGHQSYHSVSSAYSCYSSYSFASIGSFVSAVSTLSSTSVFSVMSFGSINSIMSIHSINCIGGIFQDCSGVASERGGMLHIPGTLAVNIAVIFFVRRVVDASGTVTRMEKALLVMVGIFAVALHGAYLVDGSILYMTGMALLLLSIGMVVGDDSTESVEEKEHSGWSISAVLLAVCLAVMALALLLLDHVMLKADTPVFIIYGVLAFLIVVFVASTARSNRGKPPLGQTSFVLVVILGMLIATVAPPYSEPKVGTYEVPNIDAYGVGKEKRFAVIRFGNLTEVPGLKYMHTWDDLHKDDKKIAEITFHGTDAVENAEEDHTYVIGIEQKGKDRDVPNWNFEIRLKEGDKKHDDGTDEKLYEAFGKEYEDWWLTFGAPGDATHFRQMFADKLHDPGVPHVLLEVLSEIDGRYYYEGVALMVPKLVSKDMYNADIMTPAPKGDKTKCKDNKFELFIAEYDDGGKRKQPFRDIEEGGWGHKYPKPSKITLEECKTQNYTDIAAGRYATLETLAGSRSLHNDKVNTHAFLQSFMWEMILMDPDYPFRSQYWVLDEDEILWPGLLWDYNSAGYRGKHPQSEFAITNIYPTFGWQDPLALSVQLCEEQSTLFAGHQNIVDTIHARALHEIAVIQDELKDDSVVQAFERADRRNQHFGGVAGRHLHLVFASIHDMMNKPTYTEEVEYQAWWLKTRAQHLHDNGKKDGCSVEKSRAAAWLMVLILFLPVWLFFFAIVLIASAYCGGEDGITLIAGYSSLSSNFNDFLL